MIYRQKTLDGDTQTLRHTGSRSCLRPANGFITKQIIFGWCDNRVGTHQKLGWWTISETVPEVCGGEMCLCIQSMPWQSRYQWCWMRACRRVLQWHCAIVGYRYTKKRLYRAFCLQKAQYNFDINRNDWIFQFAPGTDWVHLANTIMWTENWRKTRWLRRIFVENSILTRLCILCQLIVS